MKTRSILGAALLIAAATLPAMAEDEAPKLKSQPTGCVLDDGALFAPTQNGHFSHAVALADIRGGAKASFGNWLAKIDIGYPWGVIGTKDVLPSL